MPKQKILFIDRDGTLIEESLDKQNDSLEKLALEPWVISALLRLKTKGYRFVMVTNQDGLGGLSFPQTDFDKVQEKMLKLFGSQGITFDAVLICPHFEYENCDCRKPKVGLVLDYLGKIDKERSYVIGDRQSDCLLANNMGLKGLLYHRAEKDWWSIVAEIEANQRQASLCRQTKETRVEVFINLDKTEPINISTGLGFFDHMLEQLAAHAQISLKLKANGDVHVDEHHLIEDTALVLGKTIAKALADKQGIARYGFVLPMDEAKVEVLLDLSGRPYFIFEGEFTRDYVGGVATEMFPHFFQSLAFAMNATLHMKMN